jgi:hypothetical protein
MQFAIIFESISFSIPYCHVSAIETEGSDFIITGRFIR